MSAKKESPTRQPASTSCGAQDTIPRGDSYLFYSTNRSKSQDRARKSKLKLVAALFCTMFFTMLGAACWLHPVVVPYVMAPFAVAGAWKFCRVAYIWMVTDPFYEEDVTWR